MKRVLAVTFAAVLVIGLAGVALAHGPGWGYGAGSGYGGGWGMGPGMMGGYGMGPGMMGGYGYGPGAAGCPGFAGWSGTGPAGQQGQAITDDQAKKLASDYATKYFKGYTLERVLPFSNGFRTMYQAELKGPKGETRVLHINPWGGVMPFGGPNAQD